MVASASGPTASRPSRRESTSVGRKGEPGGIEKTRGLRDMVLPHALGEALRGGRQRLRIAYVEPLAVESHPVEPARRDRAVVEEVRRERPRGRVGEKFGLHGCDARIDEGRDLA